MFEREREEFDVRMMRMQGKQRSQDIAKRVITTGVVAREKVREKVRNACLREFIIDLHWVVAALAVVPQVFLLVPRIAAIAIVLGVASVDLVFAHIFTEFMQSSERRAAMRRGHSARGDAYAGP